MDWHIFYNSLTLPNLDNLLRIDIQRFIDFKSITKFYAYGDSFIKQTSI